MVHTTLAEQSCDPDEGGVPLNGDALLDLHAQLDDGWELVDEHHLARDVEVERYLDAVDLVVAVARIADAEGHHPDLTLSYDNLNVTVYTHKIDGLHLNDFILAAKIDRALAEAGMA